MERSLRGTSTLGSSQAAGSKDHVTVQACEHVIGRRVNGVFFPKAIARVVSSKVKMATKVPAVANGRLLEGLRKWYYNAAGFNKLGLLRDDTMYEDQDVKEALKRLPEGLYNERIFRIRRAFTLSLSHEILPKEQWVKYEEDKSYLQPYLKQVIRERLEREEWEKK